jgi:hypothetical protein
MNKLFTRKLSSIATALLFIASFANAQCTWQTQISDGFEYTTTVPDLIPGTTYQTVPQAYAVHTGAHSLYMNFVTYTGSVGTAAGTLVYSRTIPVCPLMPIRFSLWLVTSFAGPQSNMHISIVDANNTILSDTDSVACPNVPNWIQYQSGSITPLTSSVTFKMYTNVAGGNGNDLSVDDFLMERCASGTLHSTTPGFVCNNVPAVNLYSLVPGIADTIGAWTGPGATTGGYLGTFNTATNPGGTYIYNSSPFGASPGCPSVHDTVIVLKLNPPVPTLGSDTSVCLNQNLVLNPHLSTSYTYAWSNNATTPTATVSSAAVDTVVYTVHVTDTYGCQNNDTISVIYKLCTAVDEVTGAALFSVYPNPASNQLYVKLTDAAKKTYDFILTDASGRTVLKTQLHNALEQISLPALSTGMYFFRLENNAVVEGQGKLSVSGK